MNRFVWDLRYPPPLTLPYGYYGALLGYTVYTLADHAVPTDTPRQQPQGPLVVPGKYKVELRMLARPCSRPLTLTDLASPRFAVGPGGATRCGSALTAA